MKATFEDRDTSGLLVFPAPPQHLFFPFKLLEAIVLMDLPVEVVAVDHPAEGPLSFVVIQRFLELAQFLQVVAPVAEFYLNHTDQVLRIDSLACPEIRWQVCEAGMVAGNVRRYAEELVLSPKAPPWIASSANTTKILNRQGDHITFVVDLP